ncbi:hypothetical protein GGS24DRAFT_483785 [Hypoxylon argillaceum]|nr:hypothetical protein GGS24DRAFT_483785 [Hypoxylon argillaceum]
MFVGDFNMFLTCSLVLRVRAFTYLRGLTIYLRTRCSYSPGPAFNMAVLPYANQMHISIQVVYVPRKNHVPKRGTPLDCRV